MMCKPILRRIGKMFNRKREMQYCIRATQNARKGRSKQFCPEYAVQIAIDQLEIDVIPRGRVCRTCRVIREMFCFLRASKTIHSDALRANIEQTPVVLIWTSAKRGTIATMELRRRFDGPP